MGSLSTAAWAAHEVGLATAIGGTLYGRAALEPALHQIDNPEQRDQISARAWQRFSWLNLAAHGLLAGTWIVGRTMLSGREVSRSARSLTRMKDGLIAASLVTGIGSMVLGRLLGKRIEAGKGPARMRYEEQVRQTPTSRRVLSLQRTVGALGIANLIANVSILGITTVLAMEGSKSGWFSFRSRWLP